MARSTLGRGGRPQLPQPHGRGTGARSRLPTVPGRLYVVWGDLTGIWELNVERRTESVALMREAAREFLALNDTTSDLDAYLTRWYERLGQS